jgi:hypothetical protein
MGYVMLITGPVILCMHTAHRTPEFKIMPRNFMQCMWIFKTLVSVILALYIPIYVNRASFRKNRLRNPLAPDS